MTVPLPEQALADALYAFTDHLAGGFVSDETKNLVRTQFTGRYREPMQRALEAAAPHIRAQLLGDATALEARDELAKLTRARLKAHNQMIDSKDISAILAAADIYAARAAAAARTPDPAEQHARHLQSHAEAELYDNPGARATVTRVAELEQLAARLAERALQAEQAALIAAHNERERIRQLAAGNAAEIHVPRCQCADLAHTIAFADLIGDPQ